MSGDGSIPLTERDCERCPRIARVEVDVTNLKSWVSSIDKKTWAVIVLIIGNLLATVLK